LDFTLERQVVVVTHSPHFVDWKTLSEAGHLFRVLLNSKGYSEVKSASREAMVAVTKSAHANVTSRKYYDVVCKELFFSDEAVLVGGPDDVNYLKLHRKA
jgi:predicted ATP-dependent endonuclease of OLD family